MTTHFSRRLLLGSGLVLAATIAGIGLMVEQPADALAQSAPPAIPVSVATVEKREVTTWDEFSGRMEAVERVELRSRVAGAIQDVHFHEGALVNKGDLLVTIDPVPYETTVAQAEAQLEASKARVELTKLALERGRRLVESNTVAQSDLDQRLSSHHEAEANQRSAEAALRSARLDLGYTQVKAPIDGRVGKLELTVGNLVAAGSSSPVLATLVSVDPIYASFDVNEQLVSRALAQVSVNENGAPAVESIPVQIGTVEDDGTPIVGQLQFIDNKVDTASGTVRVRAAFANPNGRLLPGQFVRVRIGQPEPSPELMISERAIGTDQDKKFVLVVGDENMLDYRPIALGAWADGMRIVTSGLKAGERIVVNGLQRVRAGAVIDPQPVAMLPVKQALAASATTAQ